ncbi:MAG: energy-coupling factor ABC transporter permease [Chromatiales bacterium]|jgi:uncharacterized membrane protein
MEISGELFSRSFLLWVWVLYAGALAGALRRGAWRRFLDSEQLHVVLAASVGLMVLWTLRTEVAPGLWFHLLGLTTLTLMFGWSVAMVAGSVVLAVITGVGSGDWTAFPVNALTTLAVPATLTQVLLVVVRSALPRHFFVYVFVNAFLAGGVAAMAGGYVSTWLLVSSGAYTLAELRQTVMPFFPLMFFPEAVLNGWLMTLLVALRPRWVWSFRDDEYLHGK